MDHASAYFEVQEPLVKVYVNSRYAYIQEYGLNIGPKASLLQPQIACMRLNWSHIGSGITQQQQPAKGSHCRASAKAAVQGHGSTSILNLVHRGHGLGIRDENPAHGWALRDTITEQSRTCGLAVMLRAMPSLPKVCPDRRQAGTDCFCKSNVSLWTNNPTQHNWAGQRKKSSQHRFAHRYRCRDG